MLKILLCVNSKVYRIVTLNTKVRINWTRLVFNINK